jgi:hypothetical protein
MHRGITALILALALLAAPTAALAQSPGDEQYVDPFQGDPNGGQAEQPAPEEPAAQPPPTAEEAPATESAPAAEAAQPASPTLPRTGAPVVLLAAAGYVLLLAGIAIRRQT